MEQRSDINFSAILKFGGTLLVIGVVVQILMWLLFDKLNVHAERTEVKPSPMAPSTQEPPEPRLQVNPTQDLQSYRKSDAEMLNHYGWVDKQAGIVHIPISEAMKLVVEREKNRPLEPAGPAPSEPKTTTEP